MHLVEFQEVAVALLTDPGFHTIHNMQRVDHVRLWHTTGPSPPRIVGRNSDLKCRETHAPATTPPTLSGQPTNFQRTRQARNKPELLINQVTSKELKHYCRVCSQPSAKLAFR